MAASIPSEERKVEEPTKEMVHRTKVIQFLGRTTPIILQNDNGPCPLLAICNVLLLKNQLKLSPDISEVSQEKLLSLVAERLIDSNSNVNNKDAGYVENQQQNIADAIDLLPRLTTGIDVNIKFKRIDDFEFTPECAIFDLLDIPLYHGWIVDPQDSDTSCAIGTKSYNSLMGELVALDTWSMDRGNKKDPEEDDIDFVAATTAALGVPSPCLSRGRSFDESPISVSSPGLTRKGDIEEEAELLRILKLSEVEAQHSTEATLLVSTGEQDTIANEETSTCRSCNGLSSSSNDPNVSEIISPEVGCSFLNINHGNPVNQLSSESTGHLTCNQKDEKSSSDVIVESGSAVPDSKGNNPSASCEIHKQISEDNIQIQNEFTSVPNSNEPETHPSGFDELASASLPISSAYSDSLSSDRKNFETPEVLIPSIDDSEPLYEGEECISGITVYEIREPVYEGEVVLAKQVDKGSIDSKINCKDEITLREGESIKNFLKNSANQLTVFGLFCLLDGLKERELCVFFRNNHFNTMFKFEGELYILATDQGYINQPELVWEKLNEVNGDTIYMTGSFKEFKVEDQSSNSWDQRSALANTSDYISSIENPKHPESSFNSDLQLAIALQQEEFEQQSQHTMPQTKVTSSRLVTGPQVARHTNKDSSASVKQEVKFKEKCLIM